MNLEGLSWGAGASVQAFGVTFGVRVNDAAVLPGLLDRLPPGAAVSAGGDAHDHELLYSVVAGQSASGDPSARCWQVFVGERNEAYTPDRATAFEAFEGAVRFEVAQQADQWTFVHAGSVGWHGRAILIPGLSYSGKSRLVEALVRAGATYYSDEYAVLDERGWVHPYPKDLTLRRESGAIDRVAASETGGEIGTRPIPVGMIVATRFVPGTATSLSEVSAGAALVALLTNTVRAQIAPAHVMKTLASAVHSAVALEGPRGEAAELAVALQQRAALWISTTGETA